jgi:LPS-assembly lipoprotein
LLGALALSGCGFTPVYGPESGARTLLNTVEVDPPRDREGYLLVRHIEEPARAYEQSNICTFDCD